MKEKITNKGKIFAILICVMVGLNVNAGFTVIKPTQPGCEISFGSMLLQNVTEEMPSFMLLLSAAVVRVLRIGFLI